MRSLVVGIGLCAAFAGVSEARGRFGVGIRTTRQSLTDDAGQLGDASLRGGGVQARYRLGDRWSLELAIEGTHTTVAGGRYQHTVTPVSLSAFFHLTPRSSWDFYLLAGMGGVVQEITLTRADGTTMTEDGDGSMVHMGFGVERELGPFGVGAELRALGMSCSENCETSQIPVESTGSQLNLTLTYYF
jgi:hypothetical protein